jgi:hypothetical protein
MPGFLHFVKTLHGILKEMAASGALMERQPASVPLGPNGSRRGYAAGSVIGTHVTLPGCV